MNQLDKDADGRLSNQEFVDGQSIVLRDLDNAAGRVSF
jgi:hypothetical protein